MIKATISTFTNNSTITSTSTDSQTFYFDNGNDAGRINHLINKGNISGGISILGTANMTITNYGTMRGVWTKYQELIITLNNFGIIQTNQGSYVNTHGNNAAHFALESSKAKVAIQNYVIVLKESPSEFNAFTGYTDKTNNKNSHLIIFYNNHTPTAQNVYFKDGDSKIILDFDKGFEFGKEYKISKLVTDRSGTSVSALNVDFSRLTTRSDLFELTQNGENFIVNIVDSKTAGYSAIGSLYKANARTMNNFMILSNSMIYPRKYSKSQNLGRKNSSLRDLPTANRGNPLALSSLRADSQNLRGNPLIKESIDSALSLKSYESFSYRNESQNLQTRRIKRTNKRNYSRNVKDSSLRADSQNLRGNPNDLRAKRSNYPQNSAESKPYYFILTPFVNHNLFFESGRYNLSGFDYGLLTAFSARVAESNSLGAHFMMSYGSLGDSSDKNFRISNLNLNLGLNYKLDLIWDSYLKARGDFFYFLNQVKTLTMMEAIKPNNLGFGVSVSYGKDFDFKQGGILGIEGGLDYKALHANTITLDSMSETYQKSLYNLLYVDLGISYAKYFGNFGFNANLGIKGNITANKLAKSQISLNNFNRSVDMILDNDKILGYANLALSYILNAKNFDMDFSLAYYGNFGDRIISNGGGFEWRVSF